MKVKSIAECSPWSILQYFWPALSDYWSWKPIFGLFESGCFTKVLLYSLLFFSQLWDLNKLSQFFDYMENSDDPDEMASIERIYIELASILEYRISNFEILLYL